MPPAKKKRTPVKKKTKAKAKAAKKKLPPKKKAVKAKVPKKKAPAKKVSKKALARAKREPVRAAAGNKPKTRKQAMKKVKIEALMPLDIDPDPTDYGYLREAAAQYYTLSVNQCSLADMAKHPLFKVAGLRRLEEWSSADDWVSRRRDSMARIRQQIETRISSEIANERFEQLKALQKVYDKGIENLINGKLESNSFEGLLGAITKLAGLMDEWRERLSRQVGGVIEGVVAPTEEQRPRTPMPELSMVEARSIVKGLFKLRRANPDRSAQ